MEIREKQRDKKNEGRWNEQGKGWNYEIKIRKKQTRKRMNDELKGEQEKGK